MPIPEIRINSQQIPNIEVNGTGIPFIKQVDTSIRPIGVRPVGVYQLADIPVSYTHLTLPTIYSV